MLTPDNTIKVLKTLDEGLLEAVTTEMARFTAISHQVQMDILQEFSGVAVEAGGTIPCGLDRVQGLLEKSVGMLRASEIICRVAPSRHPIAAMQKIAEMDPRNIYNLVRNEQLQTIALVISYLTPEKASQLLSMTRPDVRERVIERLATLAPTSVHVVENVAEMLQRKCGSQHAQPVNQTGGIKVAAQLLNAMPRNLSESILVSLKERNSELGDAVRQKMFTFEELGQLEVRTIQKVLQSVDMHNLTVALKTASDKLKTTLLGCISKRAADTIREEIEFMGPLKLRDIEAAQNEIIETARRLEAEGEIDLDEIRNRSRG
jgi:flagellar motor switch protein FliG